MTKASSILHTFIAAVDGYMKVNRSDIKKGFCIDQIRLIKVSRNSVSFPSLRGYILNNPLPKSPFEHGHALDVFHVYGESVIKESPTVTKAALCPL